MAFCRRKQAAPTSEPLGPEASGQDVEADPTHPPESGAPAAQTAADPAATPDREEDTTFLAKNNISLGQKITNILARLKQTAEKKGDEKRLDVTLAEEFERVRLSEGGEGEQEGEDKEKGEREMNQSGEKAEGMMKGSVRERIRALFNRMKKSEDVEMAEAKGVEEEGGEGGDENKEERMEELEPEDKEVKKDEKVEAPRLGSETPV